MLDEWEDYIEQLCSSNKLLRHGKMDGAKKRRTFYRFAMDDAPVNSTGAASPYVQHNHFTESDTKTGTLAIYSSELVILENVKLTAGSAQDKVSAARVKTETIAKQLKARILYDWEEGDTCALFGDYIGATLEPAGLEDQTAFGWVLTVRFSKDIDNTVDPDDWEEEEET